MSATHTAQRIKKLIEVKGCAPATIARKIGRPDTGEERVLEEAVKLGWRWEGTTRFQGTWVKDV